MSLFGICDDVEGFDDFETILVNVIVGKEGFISTGVDSANFVSVIHEVGGES